MNKRSKRELTKEVHPRYLKARKGEKEKILDEFTAATGDNILYSGVKRLTK
jgi:hypothetical protein